MTAFADLGLSETTLAALRDVGYESPSPIQVQAIPLLLEGRDVIGQALKPFGPARVSVDPAMAEVTLRGDMAIGTGLLLHEMATNAVKYGALSVDDGRVDLKWTLDAAAEHLRLTWVESGGPPVSPPDRQGFGSRLIERGLRAGLGGSASMRYEPQGLTCAMEVKLPKAGELPGLFAWP